MLSFTIVGLKTTDLDHLPVGVALPIQDALARCRRNPPSDWSFDAYMLIGRADLAAQLNAKKVNPPSPSSVAEHKVPNVSESKKPILSRDDDDGMEHMDQEVTKTINFRHYNI